MAHTNPRATQYQLVHYIRKKVNYNDAGIAAGVYFGTLPAGAIIIGTDVQIDTAFNAVTTNVLTVGSAATLTEVVQGSDVTEGTIGLTLNIKPNASPYTSAIASDLDLYVSYTQTGTAATAGKAYIIVKFVLDNDL